MKEPVTAPEMARRFARARAAEVGEILETSEYIELAASFDEYVDKLRIDREVVIDHLSHHATTVGHVEATEEWLDIDMPSWRGDSEVVAALREARHRVTTGG